MSFIISLVGQNNVGKSTLFNRLTSTNHALISNYSGITRDRQYGYLNSKKFKAIIVDTGGIGNFVDTRMNPEMQNFVNCQTNLAIKESNLILFIVDGKLNELSLNYDILSDLRKWGKDIFIVVNKMDHFSFYEPYMHHMHNYYSFGIDTIVLISAIHGYGVDMLLNKIFFKTLKNIVNVGDTCKKIYTTYEFGIFSKHKKVSEIIPLSSDTDSSLIKIGMIGRPNSGKSTLVNCILGTSRMITSEIPGTTRNSVDTPLIFNEKKYILVDTAGIRKKNKIDNLAEKISIKKTFQVIKTVHVILFVIDANVGILHQDLSLLKFIMDHGKALVIVLNKWDMLSNIVRKKLQEFLYKRMKFLDFIKIHFISALYGIGISDIFQSIRMAYICSSSSFTGKSIVTSAQLTQILYQSIKNNPLPFFNKVRIKPKYVHFGGYNPPILVIHGSKVSELSNTYKRYLIRCFCRALNITGVSLRIQLKDTVNPFINNK